MLTLHRFYQKWIQLLDISLVSKELENWLLVSENTPGCTMRGVSQLFMEMLDILTAKPDSLFILNDVAIFPKHNPIMWVKK